MRQPVFSCTTPTTMEIDANSQCSAQAVSSRIVPWDLTHNVKTCQNHSRALRVQPCLRQVACIPQASAQVGAMHVPPQPDEGVWNCVTHPTWLLSALLKNTLTSRQGTVPRSNHTAEKKKTRGFFLKKKGGLLLRGRVAVAISRIAREHMHARAIH